MGLKILFLVLNRIAPNSMNVCIRNVQEIVKYLRNHTDHQADYLSIIVDADPDSQKKYLALKNRKFDRIIVIYSTYYYFKDAVIELLRNQSASMRMGWFTTDYEIGMPDFYRYIDRPKYDFVLSNFDESLMQGRLQYCGQYHMININALIAKMPGPPRTKPHNIIYYGRYRDDRASYFKRYFTPAIAVSTSKKNVKMFEGLGCHPSYYDKISWAPGRETLNLFRHSLYIEDTITHTAYNHLANRFYEALFCNVVPVFDRSCKNTIVKSGYDIPDALVVDSPDDFVNLDDWITPLIRKSWLTYAANMAINERKQTLIAIQNAIENQ